MAYSDNTPPEIWAKATTFFSENKRGYSEYGDCPLPCDDDEQDRQDIQHKFFTVTREDDNQDPGRRRSVNGLHARPLLCNEPPRILDLGCGTGIWCIDMADLYPGASILGWDLSMRMQPKLMASGMQCLPKDITDPTWDLDLNSMDLIHMRLLGGCVSDWCAVYQNVFKHLKPGTGLFEHIEIDYRPFSPDSSLPENSSIEYWTKEVYRAYEQYGKPLFPKDDLPAMLKHLGFTDITHEEQEIPYHPWPEDERLKNIARWFNLSMQSAIPAMSLAPLTRYSNWTLEQVEKLNADVKMEICISGMQESHSCKATKYHTFLLSSWQLRVCKYRSHKAAQAAFWTASLENLAGKVNQRVL
ncbi:S-adenosyl-L-methionine-dependent methyltransferase [Apiospora saccharicola]|uniref:S-adenosyl-L-methionine-dependent methyltransferase n=1 Tax=Apiospora saccharicola TaxID=335842 RepID=A0ABR1VQB9_9PEZI